MKSAMILLFLFCQQLLASVSIDVQPLKKLLLEKPLEKGRPAHVSAVSGMVEIGNTTYYISDDEMALFYQSASDKNLQSIVLGDVSLGIRHEERKRIKPDFEALAYLAPANWPPNGALLAWPSGSTLQRMKALVLPFDEKQKIKSPKAVDILSLSYLLAKEVGDVNMEGLIFESDKVLVFQRGNSKKAKSGILEFKLSDFLSGLQDSKWPSKFKFTKIKLGKLDGVKMTLADGHFTSFGLLGLAPAENTDSSYFDGGVQGTALVRIVGDEASVIGRFSLRKKFEGMFAKAQGEGLDLFLVDDADNPDVPSTLYRAHLPKSVLNLE